ncbi:MAG: 50S ribosomal protein L20 [Bacteroidota bacterium]
MPRSVNAVASRKRRKKILKAAKGYWGARSKVYTVAKNAVEKGLTYAYRDRRNKKRAFRRLWIARINAAARINNTTYSRLIHALNQNEVALNRKVLADMAMNHPATFKAIVEQTKAAQN